MYNGADKKTMTMSNTAVQGLLIFVWNREEIRWIKKN